MIICHGGPNADIKMERERRLCCCQVIVQKKKRKRVIILMPTDDGRRPKWGDTSKFVNGR
jgi:hypothetical protein